MERYSLIVVTEETAPVRRFDVRKQLVKRALVGAAIAAALLLIGLVDYVRLRVDNVELTGLRAETEEQRAKIEAFDARVAEVRKRLESVGEFERKVRVIANLPGSVATGGTDVVEVGPSGSGDLDAARQGEAPAVKAGSGSPAADPGPAPAPVEKGSAAPEGKPVSLLFQEVKRLGLVAEARKMSLLELVDQLQSKHRRLASSPAIWPTQGWLTSRFGSRISPFTGRRHFHSGIDISSQQGTNVVASARGVVKFSGKRGPLGNTVIIDHGYGVRTHYGHNSEIHVKRGQEVERGQVIAAVGNSGRSTGPHLHYTVEVKGKAVNPLDYIFD
jgi:septal ring factor EnvC (AmiA/AmiB activator)